MLGNERDSSHVHPCELAGASEGQKVDHVGLVHWRDHVDLIGCWTVECSTNEFLQDQQGWLYQESEGSTWCFWFGCY